MNQTEFEKQVLPTYFKQSSIASFYRQANGWGFRCMLKGSDKGSFYNERFLRGLPHLCKKMKRIGSAKIVEDTINQEPILWKISAEHPPPREIHKDSLDYIVLNTINKCIQEVGSNAKVPFVYATPTSSDRFSVSRSATTNNATSPISNDIGQDCSVREELGRQQVEPLMQHHQKQTSNFNILQGRQSLSRQEPHIQVRQTPIQDQNQQVGRLLIAPNLSISSAVAPSPQENVGNVVNIANLAGIQVENNMIFPQASLPRGNNTLGQTRIYQTSLIQGPQVAMIQSLAQNLSQPAATLNMFQQLYPQQTVSSQIQDNQSNQCQTSGDSLLANICIQQQPQQEDPLPTQHQPQQHRGAQEQHQVHQYWQHQGAQMQQQQHQDIQEQHQLQAHRPQQHRQQQDTQNQLQVQQVWQQQNVHEEHQLQQLWQQQNVQQQHRSEQQQQLFRNQNQHQNVQEQHQPQQHRQQQNGEELQQQYQHLQHQEVQQQPQLQLNWRQHVAREQNLQQRPQGGAQREWQQSRPGL